MGDYGKWEIVKSLGEGGQCFTYLVRDSSATESARDSLFVLKRLKNRERINRFEREIKISLALEHKNIVKIIDYNLEAGKPYMVTEYYEEGDLDGTNFDSNISWEEILNLFVRICDGVAYAHEHGVIHRDLKPKNIFLAEKGKRPVVGDFGICFLNENGQRFTVTEEAVGARLYMAPEMEDGRVMPEKITAASDVYSLGKILYWLVSGGKLFAREKHRESEWDLVNLKKDRQYEVFNRLLDKMITADPSKRFQSVEDIIREVEWMINEMIGKGANVISDKIAQLCIYCRKGYYQKYIDTREKENSAALHNFGLNPTGTSKGWMIFICDYCGNTQFFRTDRSQNPHAWNL